MLQDRVSCRGCSSAAVSCLCKKPLSSKSCPVYRLKHLCLHIGILCWNSVLEMFHHALWSALAKGIVRRRDKMKEIPILESPVCIPCMSNFNKFPLWDYEETYDNCRRSPKPQTYKIDTGALAGARKKLLPPWSGNATGLASSALQPFGTGRGSPQMWRRQGSTLSPGVCVKASHVNDLPLSHKLQALFTKVCAHGIARALTNMSGPFFGTYSSGIAKHQLGGTTVPKESAPRPPLRMRSSPHGLVLALGFRFWDVICIVCILSFFHQHESLPTFLNR